MKKRTGSVVCSAVVEQVVPLFLCKVQYKPYKNILICGKRIGDVFISFSMCM